MKVQTYSRYLSVVVCAFLSTTAIAQNNQALAPPAVISPADKAAIQTFEKQVSSYVDLRNKVKENAPKLSKDSTPEQIHAYRTALEQSLQSARANAKRGDLFRPETADYIRRTLKIEFQGKDRQQLRETIFETETQGVVLRVNYPYAQTAEFSEMPATLARKAAAIAQRSQVSICGTKYVAGGSREQRDHRLHD